MRRALLIVALSVGLASPAAAQALKLTFHDGLVSVDATGVPVRTILTEWGKQGGTKIIGAERLAGAPLTLKLVNVTEAKALESILRSVPGYMAAPRGIKSVSTGPSMYDRILVMATTSAPAAATASRQAPAPNNAFNGTQRFVPPRQQQQQQDADNQQDEPDDNPPNPPVFSFPPQPQGNFNSPQLFNGAPPQLGGQPVTVQINPQTGAPQSITINPAQPGSQPNMPAGAATPGMIVAPPQQQQQPPQPGSMIRPPGK